MTFQTKYTTKFYIIFANAKKFSVSV